MRSPHGVDSGGCWRCEPGGGGRSQTVAALETVLAELSSRGYEFRGIPACGGETVGPDATVTPSG